MTKTGILLETQASFHLSGENSGDVKEQTLHITPMFTTLENSEFL